ncbi:MAG TPA: YbgC/FadM family acyl-CoA thioesterase [Arcobacter sp.]|nr:YbgC/FadM family acyl-CoA thioesterase [Arcobacter sp.]
MQIRIYYEDTDAGGIVYHTNYIKYCERARSEKFFKNNFTFDESGYFLVTKLDAKFIKPAKLGDIIEVKTIVVQMKNASCTLEQSIYIGDEKIFVANITVAYMANGKLSKVPKEKMEVFQ